ncbi:hypothetical protein HUJ04_011060 [Dendroctonus ponderosae]|nr:hypothetical protein HUJ04_011060 [Dendroctonus ponderosae]KAH1028303.1 hypothetical protein HUJ05_001671 [Dendroctonus ponderosae]
MHSKLIKSISPWIVYVIIQLNRKYRINIFQVYASTTVYEDEEVEESFQEPMCHYTFIIGNFNAKVGRKQEMSETILGNFDLEERNEKS